MFAVWFDHRDPKYLSAYVLYKETGSWPQWVQEQIDEGMVTMHEHWELLLNESMASAWLQHSLSEYVDGLPISSVEKVLRQVSDA